MSTSIPICPQTPAKALYKQLAQKDSVRPRLGILGHTTDSGRDGSACERRACLRLYPPVLRVGSEGADRRSSVERLGDGVLHEEAGLCVCMYVYGGHDLRGEWLMSSCHRASIQTSHASWVITNHVTHLSMIQHQEVRPLLPCRPPLLALEQCLHAGRQEARMPWWLLGVNRLADLLAKSPGVRTVELDAGRRGGAHRQPAPALSVVVAAARYCASRDGFMEGRSVG